MAYLSNSTSALLFSGGMDSMIAYHLLNPDLLIHIVTGTEDNKYEQQLFSRFQYNCEIKTIELSLLRNFELKNKIIPYRNYYFVLFAAQYSANILLASTAGDTTKDKDTTFAKSLSNSLTYFAGGPKDKIAGPGPIKILLPFRNKTKRQLVAQYLAAGHDPNILIENSSSCYHPQNLQECGVCRSCLRKWIALTLNGIRPKFKTPPKQLLSSLLNKHRAQETKDIQQCLKNLKKLED